MLSGPFRSRVHRHLLDAVQDGTLRVDEFEYAVPLGIPGRIADQLFLREYLRSFFEKRAEYVKKLAESE